MKTKKIPERSCIITHEKLPKTELIRIIKTKEGKVEIDMTGKQNGRGAYLKKDKEVLKKAKKTKTLDRALKIEVPDYIYDELDKILD